MDAKPSSNTRSTWLKAVAPLPVRIKVKMEKIISVCFQLVFVDRGGGQVVSVLVFYSDGPSLNTAEVYVIFKQYLHKKKEN